MTKRWDFVICARLVDRLFLSDNITGHCSRCGHAIQFRPNVPSSGTKVCLQCAEPLLLDPDNTIEMTMASVQDAIAYFRRKMH